MRERRPQSEKMSREMGLRIRPMKKDLILETGSQGGLGFEEM